MRTGSNDLRGVEFHWFGEQDPPAFFDLLSFIVLPISCGLSVYPSVSIFGGGAGGLFRVPVWIDLIDGMH